MLIHLLSISDYKKYEFFILPIFQKKLNFLLIEIQKSYNIVVVRIKTLHSCRRVGIGRRDRLKICYPQGCVGPSPTAGTILKLNTSKDVFFFLLKF